MKNHDKLSVMDFQYSHGWLSDFKKRHDTHLAHSGADRSRHLSRFATIFDAFSGPFTCRLADII